MSRPLILLNFRTSDRASRSALALAISSSSEEQGSSLGDFGESGWDFGESGWLLGGMSG